MRMVEFFNESSGMSHPTMSHPVMPHDRQLSNFNDNSTRKSQQMQRIHQIFRQFAPRRLQVQIKSIKKLDW